FHSAQKLPAITRVLPTELGDHAVSEAFGEKLSYLGYECEVPWSDLDTSQTVTYPYSQKKSRVDLRFRSGSRELMPVLPPYECIGGVAQRTSVYREGVRSELGSHDYDVVKTIYEFTPDKMNHWSFWARVQAQQNLLLALKSVVPSTSARSGIFNVT